MIKFFENYKFTDKKHPPEGIMSVALGLIGLISVIIALIMPYISKAATTEKYAFVMVLAFVYAIIGIVLGFIGKANKTAFGLFPKVGIIINVLVIVLDIVIIVMGELG